MPCATCIIPVRRALENAPGISSIGANYVADLIIVDYDPSIIDPPRILELVKKTGYEAVPLSTPYL